MLFDRDYIQDNSGNFLKVIGNYHPSGKIVSYVKYFPSKFGNRLIGSSYYGYNSFVSKSFTILCNDINRVCYSEHHGGIVTYTPEEKIQQIYSCRSKLQEIYRSREKYINHPVGQDLINFIESISSIVDINNIGITGSFLIDAYEDSSDIDLVCYGDNAYKSLKVHFNKFVIPYKGKYARPLFRRRMIYMAPMDFDLLIKQENRKLQGLTIDNHIHINCQPLRDNNDSIFKNLRIFEVGEISCIAEIIDASEGIYSPAYYKIKVTDIIKSLFSGNKDFKKKLNVFISYIGSYSNSFIKGDLVYLDGKIVIIQDKNSTYYGIELTPWNSERSYSANLLKAAD